MENAPARARHDVDTLEDLDAARSLGVGPRTAAVLATTDPAKEAAGTVSAEVVLRRPRWQPTP
jgi:2-phospho-L-lactate guanylyltransferase (CobY/MobA/RfbA family)